MIRRAVSRIAVIHHGSSANPALAALRDQLRRRRLIDGDNCIVDAAGVEGQWDRLPELIGQLLHRRPDVLVAIGGVAALSAHRATSRVPLLHAIVLDPSDIGLTAPNVSGVTTFDPTQATRHLRLLRQLIPDLRTVVCLTDTDAPKGADGLNPLESSLQRAAAAQGLEVVSVKLPGADAILGELLHSMQQSQTHALIALEVPAVLARLGAISAVAERLRLPLLSPYGWQDGGVVMQGAALHDAIHPLEMAVAAVLQGVSVADLPVRTVRRKRLVLHRARAQRIGLQIPASVLSQATQFLVDLPLVDVTSTPPFEFQPRLNDEI